MSKSKAISPELNGLFARIEKQSAEYEKAFDDLNKFQRDSRRISRDNEELIQQASALFEKNTELCNRLEDIEEYIDRKINRIYEEVIKHLETTIIVDIKNKIDAILADFQGRANEAIGLIEGSDGIVQILDDVRNFAKELEQKIVIFDKRTEKISKQSAELESAKDDFKQLTTKLDVKINDFGKKMNATIAEFKLRYQSDFNEASFHQEERIKQFIIETKQSQATLNSRMHKSDEKIAVFLSIANQLEQHLSVFNEKNYQLTKKEISK